MIMSMEWKDRINKWRKELLNHFYIPLGTLELYGFTTSNRLSAVETEGKVYEPLKKGSVWGSEWEYLWSKASVRIPSGAERKRVVLSLKYGGVGLESVVYINNIVSGSVRHLWDHRSSPHDNLITLCTEARVGDEYEIKVETYAGHRVLGAYLATNPSSRKSHEKEYTGMQISNTIGECTFGVWVEEAYQLWLDVETLYGIYECSIDQESLRVAEIIKGLKDFTKITDFTLSYDEKIKTFIKSRERLAPLLACTNGSTSPMVYAVGHSHIDLAWLWPIDVTERKIARTLSVQLELMEEYPEYKFLQSQPWWYNACKELYPELYERLRKKVEAGQIIPEGGMWVEADTNIPGGESLIRQFLHGKRFFKEEFGIENELLWLPDVFGYSGALPQIMKGCNIKYFSTQKIYCTLQDADPFPYYTFLWEGIDGSLTLSHIHRDYNSHTRTQDLISKWNIRVQKENISSLLLAFGFGDGGGGATRSHLEFLKRNKNLEGVPKAKIANPVEFFKDIEEHGLPEEKYVGELYYQYHRGALTSQANIKKWNRKTEVALKEAEMWSAVAMVNLEYEYPAGQMDKAWKNVLFNQFHDVMAGTSIERVNKEAMEMYLEAYGIACKTCEDSTSSLISGEKDGSLTVFNSLSWDRCELAKLPEAFSGCKDIRDETLAVQEIDGSLYALVKVPGCGYTTVYACEKSEVKSDMKASSTMLENDLLKVFFNHRGEITGIFDKESGMDMTNGVCNSFKMYRDEPSNWDAWEIDSIYEQTPVSLEDQAEVTVLHNGPLAAGIKVERKLHQSHLTQEITLRKGSKRIDFKTTIDWKEAHKLLKVNFPVNIHSNEAVHEIQFGFVSRPNHKSRKFDRERFEVCNHKWTALKEENRGCAVLNDCKYGVNVSGNSINLTLLKAPMRPDLNADVGVHEFTYSFYAWNSPFTESRLVQEAYELNCPVTSRMGEAGEKSFLSLDAGNIVIEAVKPAEDGSRDIVIRLYEAKRMSTRCSLKINVPVQAVFQTDMLENPQAEIEMTDNSIGLYFKPFEIKTIRLKHNAACSCK